MEKEEKIEFGKVIIIVKQRAKMCVYVGGGVGRVEGEELGGQGEGAGMIQHSSHFNNNHSS